MKSSSPVVPFMAILMLLLLLAPPSEAEITCDDVIGDIQPCRDYLQHGYGTDPPPECCEGARKLALDAETTADKQTACDCIKVVFSNVFVDPELAKELTEKCGVNLPFTFSPDEDCSKIS